MGDALRAAHDREEPSEIVVMLDKLGRGIVERMAATSSRALTLPEALQLAWDGLCAAKAHSAPRLMSGFRDLDHLTGGFRGGNLIVLAARPAMGKTALMLQIAGCGAEQGLVVVFSFEQTTEELAQRIISARTQVPLHAMRNGTTLGADDTRIVHAIGDLQEGRQMLIDDRAKSVSEMSAMVRLHSRKAGLALIVVDYLQLIQPEDRRAPLEQQIAQISRALKLLAMECKVPVLVLAQLNRGIEKRPVKDRTPRLSDLRESGAIEQDADIDLFIDRPATYDTDAQQHEAKLHVAKHRSGKTGTIDLDWDGGTTSFHDVQHSDGGFFGGSE